VVVHGDGFTVLGHEKDMVWSREKILGSLEYTFRGRLGLGEKDQRSMRTLNRVIEWTDVGIRCEAGQRHAWILVEDLGLGGRVKIYVSTRC
jgi:hypothetical protein